MLFKAVVRDKKTRKISFLEENYPTKKEFINDIRANGYSVNPNKVKPSKVFNYIMEKTDCNSWDWKNNN